MKYIVKYTARFQKDYKILVKRRFDVSKVHEVIEILASGNVLPGKYHDHALSGNYQGARECHIKPDWLLIYSISNEKLILELMRTGSHSDLF